MIIVGIVLLLAMWFIADNLKDSYPEPQPMPDVPTAQEIADLIIIPDTNNEVLDEICENTDGCAWYEPKHHWQKWQILQNLDDDDAWDDFDDELEEITDIDQDDLDFEYDMEDYQIRAYSLQDKKDGNWEVKVFVKITYWDVDDEDDKEKVYLLITTVLEEGEYEDMTVEEVTRHFEFE